jgi:transposase
MSDIDDTGTTDTTAGAPRVIRPRRNAPMFDVFDPDAWLPADHVARAVWTFVESQDLSRLYDAIKARGSAPGRPASDPAVLFALWLLGTIDGIGSARELERATRTHLPFMWLAQGVPVNYHGLADFRLAHAGLVDDLLSSHLAALVAAGIANPVEIIIDGTKIAASANKDTYRRKSSLGEIEKDARARVDALKKDVEADPGAGDRRRKAADVRAARERAERAEKAKQKLAEIEKEREERAKTSPKEVAEMREPRASTTDPDARKMRCADGTVRPAYNIQIAVTFNGIITGIAATDRRQDTGLLSPMIEQVEGRTGKAIATILADTGYADHNDIAALATRTDKPVTAYVPLPEERTDVKPATLKERERKRAKEPQAIKDWRNRMDTDEAKTIMKQRGSIERVNAHVKGRGLARVTVRGLAKVHTITLWHALANNITAGLRLAAAAARSDAAAVAGPVAAAA